MKRNRFGTNLDEGVPLLSQDDFDLLYVDCFEEIKCKLLEWIQYGQEPLILGGQIGSGKTTLIQNVINSSSVKPDIYLKFDQDVLNLDAGDFWAITLAGFINAAFDHKIDLSFSNLPLELAGHQPDDWKSLYIDLVSQTSSMYEYDRKIHLRRKISEIFEYIKVIICEIGKRLEELLERRLIIYASGSDKFDDYSPSFFSLMDVLLFLCKFKTLFEMNAIHLFHRHFSNIEKTMITTITDENIIKILEKRMGRYAQPIQEEIEILAQWSGGNPRQALRLLDYFQIMRRNYNCVDSIKMAINKTSSDFFAYSRKPSNDLIKTIKRSGELRSDLITLTGDSNTARLALYGNWIFLKGIGNNSSWPVLINPLIKGTFEIYSNEDIEVKHLLEYAKNMGISGYGLDFNLYDPFENKEKSGEQLYMEYLYSGIEKPVKTNLSEVFDILRVSLLSANREDRTIIAYDNHDMIEASRAYLFAEANTYEYQPCRHYELIGGKNQQPIRKLREILADNSGIISIEFKGCWEPKQLETLNRMRDCLINYQMLWWIKSDLLKTYLPYWVQLRQLFEILHLEDELLNSISIQEIEEDIAFYNELDQSCVVDNLKVVLEHIRELRGL